MDFLALVALLAVFAVALALASRRPLDWIREEWRLMWAETWARAPERVAGGSIDEPRVKAMDTRMRAYAKRLRREGRSLTAGKRYIPALTKPADPPTTRPANVTTLRKTR